MKRKQLLEARGPAAVCSLLSVFASLFLMACGNHDRSDGVTVDSDPLGSTSGGAPIASGGTGGAVTSPGNSGGVNENAGGTGGGQSEVGAGGTLGGQQPGAGVERQALVVTWGGGCALDGQGSIKCWGGWGGVWDIPAGTFVALVSNGRQVCGIRNDSVVQCFHEPDRNGMPTPPQPQPVEGAVAVAVGWRHVYTLDEGGKVSALVQLPAQGGIVPLPDDSAPPIPDERFFSITAGAGFTCGIRRGEGSILCWGWPGMGPGCGLQNETAMVGQLQAPSGTFVDVSSGGVTSCAVRASGELACWGHGKPPPEPNPYACDTTGVGQAVPPAGKFKRVAMGWEYGCAVAEDGHVECWGDGTQDSCNDNEYACRQARPPAGTFDQVAVGPYFHSCAMTADRKITCWGYAGPDGGDGRLVPPEEFR